MYIYIYLYKHLFSCYETICVCYITYIDPHCHKSTGVIRSIGEIIFGRMRMDMILHSSDMKAHINLNHLLFCLLIQQMVGVFHTWSLWRHIFVYYDVNDESRHASVSKYLAKVLGNLSHWRHVVLKDPESNYNTSDVIKVIYNYRILSLICDWSRYLLASSDLQLFDSSKLSYPYPRTTT